MIEKWNTVSLSNSGEQMSRAGTSGTPKTQHLSDVSR